MKPTLSHVSSRTLTTRRAGGLGRPRTSPLLPAAAAAASVPAAAAKAANFPLQDEQIELMKDNDDMKLLVEIYLSELSRVRYLLRAYLRVRLQKVERHVMHILDNAGANPW